jgi:hypothetical protein
LTNLPNRRKLEKTGHIKTGRISPMANALALVRSTGAQGKLVDLARRQDSKIQRAAQAEKALVADVTMKTGIALGAILGGVSDAVFGEGTEDAKIGDIPVVPIVGLVVSVAGFFPKKVPAGAFIGSIGVGATAYSLGNIARDVAEDMLED